jgi:hypothetical protein
MDEQVRAVQFNGITFTQSQYTCKYITSQSISIAFQLMQQMVWIWIYVGIIDMDPHGVPSGGDWALEPNAAILMQGTEDCTIEQCTFTRLDGNAIMLFGYHRATIISR